MSIITPSALTIETCARKSQHARSVNPKDKYESAVTVSRPIINRSRSKMRAIFIFALTIFGYAATAAEYYSNIYDKTNVELILKNERLFKPYLACILDKGPCTADARAFKTIFPHAITTNCARCNPRQKDIAITIIRHLKEHRPESYSELVRKYDPDNQFIEKFNEFLEQDRSSR